MQRLLSRFSHHVKDPLHERKKKMSPGTPSLMLMQIATDCNDAPFSTDLERREVKISDVTELGNVLSTSTFVKRDLGFQGQLGSYILLTYGDTMFSDAEGSDQFRGMTCNSVAIAGKHPTKVLDPRLDQDGFPHCFLRPSEQYNEDPSVYALGLTNVVEISPGKGIVFFLLNHRPDYVNHLIGAGVADVSLESRNGVPVPMARRHERFWWDGEIEPWYGDICALKAGAYVYAYGHAKDNPWVYLARARTEDATVRDAYEYWNGVDWQRERLRRQELNEKQSVFWQINQGQVIWSRYHNCFLFVYCDNFWSCQVLVRTAPSPEGPWLGPITIYKPRPITEDGNVYAAIPHPYFDPSGRTLVISYTNHPNTVQAIKVVSAFDSPEPGSAYINLQEF